MLSKNVATMHEVTNHNTAGGPLWYNFRWLSPETASGYFEEDVVAKLYANAALIECADAEALETALGGGLERYVVRRLSETTVVVDHERMDEILKLLRRQGQTPQVTDE